jgi:hypothetical protein
MFLNENLKFENDSQHIFMLIIMHYEKLYDSIKSKASNFAFNEKRIEFRFPLIGV